MADSPALVNAMADLGARPSETMVINWGVDPELFRPAPGAGRGAGRPRAARGRVVLTRAR